VLEQLKQSGRKPKTITVDNGSEFTAKELDTWSYLSDSLGGVTKLGDRLRRLKVRDALW
jgi:hypothetical protein